MCFKTEILGLLLLLILNNFFYSANLRLVDFNILLVIEQIGRYIITDCQPTSIKPTIYRVFRNSRTVISMFVSSLCIKESIWKTRLNGEIFASFQCTLLFFTRFIAFQIFSKYVFCSISSNSYISFNLCFYRITTFNRITWNVQLGWVNIF